jgi:uncharacterized protein (DUF302 family)
MPLTTVTSGRPVRETVDRLVAAVEGRGSEVFARIDHGGGARAVGLELADEELLVFGDPRVGTLLMQADPTVGYELPLRILVWDDAGTTKIAWRPSPELVDTYALSDRTDVLEKIGGLVDQLVREAA